MKLQVPSVVVRAAVLTATLAGLAVAQLIMGSLTGLVTDPAGAAVPSVTVIARNTATGVLAETRSSATGNFVIANLQPGTYALEVTAPGFKTWIHPGIVVSRATTCASMLSCKSDPAWRNHQR
jgi:hypothetical protein